MSDHSDDPDDEDEAQVHELAAIDLNLDDEQARLDELMHTDTVGVIWFGDSDDWIDKRLNNDG